MNCAMPWAPARLTALGSKLLSCRVKRVKKSTGRPCDAAAPSKVSQRDLSDATGDKCSLSGRVSGASMHLVLDPNCLSHSMGECYQRRTHHPSLVQMADWEPRAYSKQYLTQLKWRQGCTGTERASSYSKFEASDRRKSSGRIERDFSLRGFPSNPLARGSHTGGGLPLTLRHGTHLHLVDVTSPADGPASPKSATLSRRVPVSEQDKL